MRTDAALPAADSEDDTAEEDDDENDEDNEGEEEESEMEGEEEGKEEREARMALAASAPREVLVPSLHPHALEPCLRSGFCNVRGPGCCFSPTAYTCTECSGWDVCQLCFDKAPREGPEPSGAKDAVADLLFEISQATHDDAPSDEYWPALHG